MNKKLSTFLKLNFSYIIGFTVFIILGMILAQATERVIIFIGLIYLGCFVSAIVMKSFMEKKK